jgi:diguanylate cyclase (GGDEF)-like protein
MSGEIIKISNSFSTLIGHDKDLLVGTKHYDSLNYNQQGEKVFLAIVGKLKSSNNWSGILKIKNTNGEPLYFDTKVLIVTNKDDEELLWIKKEVTNEVYKKRFCPLTNLRNKSNLMQFLSKKHKQLKIMLAILNIDDFTAINNIYSGDAGDGVLIFVANLLSKMNDFRAFRLKDDEFALVYAKRINVDNEALVFAMLHENLNEIFNVNVDFENSKIHNTITVGIACDRSSTVLEKANLALKEAKRSNSRFYIYSDTLEKKQNKKQNLEIIAQIHESINNNEVLIYYQPIVCCRTRDIYKYEALVRIRNVDGIVLLPFQFLELAQKVKIYNLITQAILKKVFGALLARHTISLSVNITMEDIQNTKTNELIFELLQSHKIEVCSRLTFEIVETIDIEDYEVFNDFSDRVRELGSKIAIDDFGSGYSNLSRLIKMSFDYLKIDGELIVHINNPKNLSILKFLVAFCKENNIKTIAEYVETKEVFDLLCEIGIDYVQGYYFGKAEATPIIEMPSKE